MMDAKGRPGHRNTALQRFAARSLAVVALILAIVVHVSESDAQQSSGGLSDILNGNLSPEQMIQMFTSGRSGLSQSPSGQSQTTIMEPSAPSNPVLPRSRLELIMSARAGVLLSQFGYDQLGVGRSVAQSQVGGVPDNYVLGPGDEIVATFRGQENAEFRADVDRNGTVVLPKLPPIPAAGRTLGDFRASLDADVGRAYVSTRVFVSVSRIRQISVIVAGEVWSPGVRTLTGLSSPIDALLVSGGIKKSGSLRNVQIVHQGHVGSIDLYAYLTNGVAARQALLTDGDRIVVPPLGKTVSASGWVRRPGIYELAPGQSAVSVHQLLELAGGTEVRGRYRQQIMRIEPNGQTQLAPVTSESQVVGDSDMLVVLPEANQVVDRATLSGGTPLAGSYSIKPGMHVSELLKSPGALGSTPYTVFGIISRKDPRTYLRTLIAFSPIAALSGTDDPELLTDDVVRVFSMNESRMISKSLADYEKFRNFREELSRNPYATGDRLGTQNGPASNARGQSVANMSLDQSSAQWANYERPPPCIPDQLSPFGQPAPGETAAAGQAAPYGYAQQSPYDQSGSNTASSSAASSGQGSSPNSAAALGLAQSLGLGNASSLQNLLGSNAGALSKAGAGAQQAAEAAAPSTSGLLGGAPPGSEAPSPGSTCVPAPNLEQELSASGAYPANTEARSVAEVASQLEIDTMVLVNFLEDHEVTLDGAVRGPGAYVIGPGINLHDLIMVAGGTYHWADQSGVELISTRVDETMSRSLTQRINLPLTEANLSNYIVHPRDELRFHEVFTDTGLGSVTLEGEVRFPGQYKIIRGEHLSDLLKRAGGLTDVSYPYGTIFLRRSVAALEEESFRRTAEGVENQLILAMSHGSNAAVTSPHVDPQTFGTLQIFVNAIRNQKGLGRISVVADPAILARKAEANVLLESGDVVFIPQRPSTVSVMGEVMQPGSFVYQPGMSAKEYLSKAGGFSGFADDSLTFIVFPDGSAKQLEDGGWLPFGSQPIPPGSVIVVPRDIAPLLWADILQNATQVFSQLAVAGASLAVISQNLH